MEDWEQFLYSCWQQYKIAKFVNCCQDIRPSKFFKENEMKHILFCATMEKKMICRELCNPGAMLMNLISYAILIPVLIKPLFRKAIAIPQKMMEYS